MSTLNASSVSAVGVSNSQIQLKKLKQQNIQLHKQVFQLQTQVNQVLTRHQHKKIKNLQVQKQLTSLYGQQIDEQQKKIKKLKEQVYYLKSSNAKLNIQYLNKQQDQLALLIHQKKQLLAEKELLKNYIKDKQNVLHKNHGLQSHKLSLQTQYTQNKKSNSKKIAQIVQIQRELRKYHFIAETVKNHSLQNSKNQHLDPTASEMQFQQLVHQISKTQREIKQIEERWKPSIESLDNQYFTLSAEDKTKKTQLQALIKRFKVIQHRSKSLRDEGEILQDRNRLSKIVTSTSSVGFNQLLHKKKSIKESEQYFAEAEKKTRIKSDFIMKEFENLKVKNKKQRRQSLGKPVDLLLSHNKTFDLGLQKQILVKNQQKQAKFTNRSMTQAELPIKQKIKLRAKQQSDQKQAQLKIQQSKPKITKNQSIKSNNPKSLNIEPKARQKFFNSENQIKQTDHIKSSPKHLIKQQKIQSLDSSKEKPTKKDPQTSKLAAKNTQVKELRQNPPTSLSKIKIPQNSKISTQKYTNNEAKIKSIKETPKQAVDHKAINQKVLEKSKKKQKIDNKSLYQEQVPKMARSKSNDKADFLKVTQNIKAHKKQAVKQNRGNQSHLQRAKDESKKQNNEMRRKDKKMTKQLKQSIQIKQKEKEAVSVNLEQNSLKKNKKKSLERLKEEPKQSQRFEIRLENKANKNFKSQKYEDPKENSIKAIAKSLEPQVELKQNQGKGVSSKKDEQTSGMSSQMKQQVIEEFKPYLIKRKRQGGALNFKNKEEQSREKANLLQLIEKQSIGVGIQ